VEDAARGAQGRAVRRRTGHALFAAAAVALSALVVVQCLRLAQAERVNRAIALAARPDAIDRGLSEARYAHALALARTGRYEEALAAQKAFVQSERGPLRRAMQYDLGNLHLREALRRGMNDLDAALPLVELAKQSYRDVLRADPDDWDARFNLERALALAPEADDEDAQVAEPPANKERTVTTARVGRKDLP
jgi:mxaK protein